MLSSHPEMCFRYRNNVCVNIKVSRYLLSKVEKGPFNRNQTLKFNVLESRKITRSKIDLAKQEKKCLQNTFNASSI